MRRELVLMLACLIAAPAQADLLAAPNFSAEEKRTIARNELLREIVDGDPWLVKMMLDMAANSPHVAGPQSADENPDLDIVPRDALGIVEWNDLVRRAKRQKEQGGRSAAEPMQRSAEGALDLIDLARSAKQKKVGTSP